MTGTLPPVSIRSLFIAIVVAFALAGCAGGPQLSDRSTTSSTRGAKFDGKNPMLQGAAATSAESVFSGAALTSAGKNIVPPPEDYRISALDVIEVSVFQVDELTRTVQVNSQGLISLPLIGSIKAGGKTATQLESEVARKLEAKYLQSPQVQVYVKEYTSQRVTVDGAVRKPGIFASTGRLSLLQAIALAEGLNEVADTSGIIVFRTIDNRRMAARFDLTAIRRGQADDPLLRAGDVVMVDESKARTTFRDVKSALSIPGLFTLLAL